MTSQQRAALPETWRVILLNEPLYDDKDTVKPDRWRRRREVSLHVERPGHRPVWVEFRWRAGRYVPTAIVNGTDAGLSAADLTDLRLTALAVEAWNVSVLDRGEDEDGRACWITGDLLPWEPPPTTRGPGSTIPHERLEVAAAAWKQADRDAGNKQQYVADALHLSRPQASVYIKRARDAGLIPPRENRKG